MLKIVKMYKHLHNTTCTFNYNNIFLQMINNQEFKLAHF